jgi:hypothetical protein
MWLRSLRCPAVKGAASRLASLGPVGPPLTAGPLRLDGNEGPLTRTSSKPSDQRTTHVFRQFEYPDVASHCYLEPALMTALATETTTFCAGADTHEASEVFHVEHRRGPTGQRVELARYTVASGDLRIVYGQRVDGVVRFLPEQAVVLDTPSGANEDGNCCRRATLQEGRCPNAARQNPPDGGHDQGVPADGPANRGGRTGPRVELARYIVRGEERVLYGQRVLGVVRLTDVPIEAGGRAYLVERGLEEEGSHANAALQAVIADYLSEARRLDAVPMAESPV